jgi:hypothetical protein
MQYLLAKLMFAARRKCCLNRPVSEVNEKSSFDVLGAEAECTSCELRSLWASLLDQFGMLTTESVSARSSAVALLDIALKNRPLALSAAEGEDLRSWFKVQGRTRPLKPL